MVATPVPKQAIAGTLVSGSSHDQPIGLNTGSVRLCLARGP
jgi:hypothetical protein